MPLNITGPEDVSPVTLNDHWDRLARLILLVTLSAIGNVGNVFMISAVMIEDYLRKRGNTFLVNVAFADLLISGLVIPASAVVILAGLKNNLEVCRFQWFLAGWCFLVTVLSLSAVAAENYFRLCYSIDLYTRLTRRKITFLLVWIWTVCGCVSGAQFFPDLSFDYCSRKYLGLIPYQATIFVVLVLIPLTISFLCYARACVQMRMYKARSSYKTPITFNWDRALMQTNLAGLIVFISFWLPFGVALALGSFRSSVFYNLAWVAISKSCVNSIVYGVLNRHFRAAYINLFQYCCCKTTVSFSRRQRPECVRPSGDVRVHIIPGYNMYCSPQRAQEGGGRSKRGATAARSNGKEVYEL